MLDRAPRAPVTSDDFTLAEWLVQPSLNRLTKEDIHVRLRPQLMDVLVCLAVRASHTVSKDEILDLVWPGQFIAESGLARCVAELRQALGDTRHDSRFIETIPKRGYRLIAPVAFVPAAPMPGLGHTATSHAAVALMDATSVPAPATDQLEAIVPPEAVAELAPSVVPVHPVVPADHDVSGTSAAPVVWPPAVRGGTITLSRRVALAAVAAFVLMVLAAGGVTAWRTWFVSGPTPAGPIVVAFENKTGESVFDDTLRLALEMQIEQSPYLRVVPERRVRDELPFMDLPADAAITRQVGLEACRRIGGSALLAGSITPIGQHFVIGIEGIGCSTGDRIVEHQLEVANREGVLSGLGQAVSTIRRQLGESVASIRRNDVPVIQATTASLDALEAFSRGDAARNAGRDEDAVRFYRRAIAIDRSFALAHVRLGLHLLNLNRRAEGVESLKAAYAARDRASAGERLYISSSFENHVLRDPVKALVSLESWRDTSPLNAAAHYSLAAAYNQLGRQTDGMAEAREALRLDPGNVIASTLIGQSLVQLGRFREAEQILNSTIASHPGSVLLHVLALDIAFRHSRSGRHRAPGRLAVGLAGGLAALLRTPAGHGLLRGPRRRSAAAVQHSESLRHGLDGSSGRRDGAGLPLDRSRAAVCHVGRVRLGGSGGGTRARPVGGAGNPQRRGTRPGVGGSTSRRTRTRECRRSERDGSSARPRRSPASGGTVPPRI